MPDLSLPIHDPVLIFALVMSIVLLAPLAFARMRVPGLVGLILCGAVVGPSGLGLLERDATMILLGTVGLLYLMFVAGLALDLNQFHRQRNRSIVFGLLSFLLPQAMGIAAGLYILGYGLPAALLLGSIVGSHTLLAYPIASRLGITKNSALIMTMGGTIVTDMLALLLLAVVVAFTAGSVTLLFWVRFVVLIAAYLALVLMGLPRLGRWFLRITRNDPNVAFVFLVAALFVTAYLAGLAGLAPIIGAFMAGLVLNRLVPEIGPLMSRLTFVGEALFIPFFLISVGMLVDFGVLVNSLAVWVGALTFTAVVFVGKGLAAWASRALYGYTAEEGWVVFGLSVPQAAATLAVTLVGFELALFDQTAVNAVVVMILLTCLVGPWFVERYGRRVALQEEAQPYRPSEAPQRILIPLSNPTSAGALVDFALAIRDEDSEEPVFPLAVVRGGDDVGGQVAAGEQLLSHAVVHAVAADVPVTPMTRVDTDAASGIARAIAERRISHVVIGWAGAPSPTQRVFGSVLDRLLEHSREAVLVCKIEVPVNTMERIILAVPPLAEREPGFDETLRTVKRLASRIGASVSVIVEQQHQAAVEGRAQAAKPDVPLTFLPLQHYHGLLQAFTETLTDTDLVVLLSAREEQISWQPALDRLPRLFSARFAGRDFVVAYPEAGGRDDIENGKARRSGIAAAAPLPDVRVVHDPNPASPSSALYHMLGDAFADQPSMSPSLAAQLLGGDDMARQEITPGVVLLHTHTAHVSRRLLLVGVSERGIPFDGLTRPAEVVFALLSPAGLAPEEHLQTLAHVARAVHQAREPEDSAHAVRIDVLLQALGVKDSVRG